MSPQLATLDHAHERTADAVLSTNVFVSSRGFSDFFRLLVVQFGFVAVLAALKVVSVLGVSIFCVGFVRAKEQMIRIHARWHVAAVKNTKAIWNRSLKVPVRNPVCGEEFPVDSQHAVAVWVSVSHEQPAGVGLFDLRHQSVFDAACQVESGASNRAITSLIGRPSGHERILAMQTSSLSLVFGHADHYMVNCAAVGGG